METAEHFLSIQNKLGEGPLWHADERALYWVDIEEESFHRYYLGTDKLETFQVGQPVGFLAFRSSGGLFLGLRDGLAIWDFHSGDYELYTQPEKGRKNARFNDGKVDPGGRLWAGTLGNDSKSKLYRLDQDGSFHVMQKGVKISNGLGWSPDREKMYYTDSPRRVIYEFDYDLVTGGIGNRRNFVKVPKEDGVPDGLCVDSEGFVWSAHWDGWRITRYDPEGKIERVIYLPVQRPTSCAFGGREFNQLFITSAWTGLSESERKEQPLAGDLFKVSTLFKGQPVNFFEG
jgi:sugar lactone lactonase YvrE